MTGKEDEHLELFYKEGKTYWVPEDRTTGSNKITNFAMWEQALWVFSDIYTRCHPGRVAALI